MTSFNSACAEARDYVGSMRSPVVMGHYDCDGLSSTAITVLGLRALGIQPGKVLSRRKISEPELAELKGEKEIIVVDFGAGMHEQLAELGAKVLIIDHHQAEESKVMQVNPHLYGIDGGTELSAAGTAYCTFEPVLPDSAIDLALVGAVGDMQYPFIGENRRIMKKGVKAGRVKCENDLTLFGRVSRPLIWFLTYSTDVYLPGLTGNEAACAEFLKGIGIRVKDGEQWRKYSNLNETEKQKLRNALTLHLEKNGLRTDSLVGEVYTLLKQPSGTELYDANEFSTVLNACGRQSEPEVGIALCLEEKGSYDAARVLLLKHRSALREGIEYAEGAVEDFGPFYFLDARGIIDDGIVGVVAGMLYSVLQRDKPIIAAAIDKDGRVKISGRGTKEIIGRGINLGNIMREAGGPGCGGHAAAAGANIKDAELENFLLSVGKLIGDSNGRAKG